VVGGSFKQAWDVLEVIDNTANHLRLGTAWYCGSAGSWSRS
jgi:hypothetical protein